MKKIIALILLTQIGVCFAANTIIAIVDKEPITLQSIENEISLTSSYDEKMSVLNNQINTLIQLKKASELKLFLSQSDINKAIENVAKYNNLNVNELKNYPEFLLLEKKIIINLTLLKLQQFITRDLEIKISKKELSDNCKLNSNNKKQIKIAQIIISEVENTDKSNISNELRVKKFLKKLSNHISKGASFEVFAKLHSQHPSYVNGGLSEWLFIDNPFLEMLDKLEDKEVSKIYPIKESWGIAIKADERLLDLKLGKCKDDLKNIKTQDFYLLWLKKLRSSSNIEIFSHKL
jgi:parvulin-like peptidyl-prolyl isomerase